MPESRRLTESRSVRFPREESDEDKSENIIKRSIGQGQYQGPETGIDVSYQSNLGEQDGEVVESPCRDEEWLREQYDETGSASG